VPSPPTKSIDRLSAADLSMVWPEEFGWPQDIGAIAILEGSHLVDEHGRFRVEFVREQVGRRLHLVPRFRQLLYMPRWGLGWPLWVDSRRVDLDHHVGVVTLEAGAGDAELLAACERLRRRPLDRSRPLWRLWFLPGLPGGRVGMFMRLHHAVADGVAGVAAFGALLDFTPDALPPVAPPWTPSRIPSNRELLRDNARRRLASVRGLLSGLVHPAGPVREIRQGWPAVREAFGEGPAPRTTLNRRVGWDRRLAVVRSDLDQVKAVAHEQGGTVNDVVLAAVAGGLRHLLLARGERVEHLVLRAFVPVSLHRERTGQARGNLDGAMVVPIPVGEPDFLRRLRSIAGETAERKKKRRPPGATLLRTRWIQRAFLRHAGRQRFMNVYVANVPGPPVQLYLAGAPLLEVFPLVPLIGNLTIGIGALSYAGQLDLTVVADRDGCPDIEVFAEGLNASMDQLTRSVVAVQGTTVA
jgi:diacylglycerol O-acyltransferase / wax synthase